MINLRIEKTGPDDLGQAWVLYGLNGANGKNSFHSEEEALEVKEVAENVAAATVLVAGRHYRYWRAMSRTPIYDIEFYDQPGKPQTICNLVVHKSVDGAIKVNLAPTRLESPRREEVMAEARQIGDVIAEVIENH
jgi:hypothetical protein